MGFVTAPLLYRSAVLRLAQELVADPEKLVRAVERDRGLMETFLDFVRGLKNRIAIRLSGSERAMLDEAERTLVNLLRGEAGSVAGEKYSFVRATDAEQIARAQELEAQGENAKTIWSETHLTRDGGGAWRWKRGGPAKQTWTGWSIWRARRKWSCNMCSSRAAGCRPRCRADALR